MRLKTTLAALVLAALPATSFAFGCSYDRTPTSTAATCGEGQTYDATTGTCVPSATS
jgi:hypothetical protein